METKRLDFMLDLQIMDVKFDLAQKAKILVIDDEPIVRLTVEALFTQENIGLIFAENGKSGLQMAEEFLPDAILLDLMMPDMDGFEVCRRLRSNPKLAEVPIIIITAVDNREARILGLDAGADDFLTKPFDSLEIQIKVKNILKLNRFQNIIKQRDDLVKMNAELFTAYDKTIEGWSNALDLRDHETEGHTLRVTEATIQLATLAGITDQNLIHIRRGALLHDIGKLGIPDSILLKPGRLTDEEWQVMRMHPVYAYRWLSDIQYLQPALDIPYCHHERWNGSGYPRKLAGREIPLPARIFSIIDVWDALRSERPYRAAMPEADVRQYLSDKKGIEFDPDLVDLFLTRFVQP
jgi:putative two-component system response regulator